jgi:hypothetical protein
VQTTKLVALSLAIILAPRLALTDVVGSLGHAKVQAGAAATKTVEAGRAGSRVRTPVPSADSAGRHSGPTWARSKEAKIKGRWASPRRLALLRRPASKALPLAPSASGFRVYALAVLAARSCSNCSGVSGRAKR